jgi:dTDP-4-dehydrorhamnose 3,5-epimerase
MEQITPLVEIEGAFILTTEKFEDKRGSFQECFNIKHHNSLLPEVKQVSFSRSHKNTLRGIHCSSYSKLVQCVSGRVIDYCIDLRENSPTFKKWGSIELNGKENTVKQLFIPPRCGHAFVSLEDNSCIMYCQGGTFEPTIEIDINWKDPSLGIQWSEPLDNIPFTISIKDANAPFLDEALKKIKLLGS